MMKTLIALLSLFCLTMAPAALASNPTVLVAGSCYDASGDGGTASVGIGNGTPDLIDVPEALSAVAAVQAFVTGTGNPTNGTGCSSTTTNDYLYVHITDGSLVTVFVCYNGALDQTYPC